MYSLKDEFTEIDRFVYNRLNLKFKKPYGLVMQLKYAGDASQPPVANIADNPQHIEDGDVAFFDDRYHVVWYHRLENIFFEKRENSYGRYATPKTAWASGRTVFWGRRDALDIQGQARKVYLTDFIKEASNILLRKEDFVLRSWDVDQLEIERQEFGTQKLHKESYLARLNFNFRFNLTLCDDICEEIDCCNF